MSRSSITPLEIEKTVLKRSLRGYAIHDVDELLKTISRDYERALNELADASRKLENTNDELARFKNIEETLKEALILAQTAADETRINARKEAELILSETRQKASEMEDETKRTTESMRAEIERLKNDKNNLLSELRSLLNSFLSKIDSAELNAPQKAVIQSEFVNASKD